jgi:integrase
VLLTEVLDEYLSAHAYGVSAGHAKQMRYNLSGWAQIAGHLVTLDDLSDQPFNTYVDWLRTHRAPDTVRTVRGNLLILWHHAFETGLIDTAPRRIRKLRPVRRCPVAWTLEEARTLFATAEGLRGCFHGTRRPRAAWWSSLCRAGYDTGLRLGDLLALHVDMVRGLMLVVQHKTGRWVAVRIRPATLAAIDQTLAEEPRDIVWPLWCGRPTFYEHVRSLVSASGIRPGTFRWLRRTACTQLERVSPGRGTELLGHASRSTTEAWYLDRSQLADPPLPPL